MFEKHSNALYIVMKNGSRLPESGSWSLHIVAAPRAASRQRLLKAAPEVALKTAPKSGSQKAAPAPKGGSRAAPPFCAMHVRKYVSWLPGAAKVWRLPGQLLGGGSQGNGSRGRSTAPETIPGHATVWPILFSCCWPFPKLAVDGGVFETYFRDLWH